MPENKVKSLRSQKFIVAFSCLKYILVHFTKNEILGLTIINSWSNHY